MRGKLICLEGVECVGKTSVINALREVYPDAVFTREPGGTPIAEQLRQFIFQNAASMCPETEATLFYAARIEHAKRVIVPALESGKNVFTDRYYWSTLAYQAVLLDNTEFVDRLHSHFHSWLPEPDCTVWLDASVVTMLRRKASRGIVAGEEINQLEDRDRKTFERIRNRFVELYENELNGISRIDAELPLDTVIKLCINKVRYVLGEHNA
jgi:dTMP kinase